MRKDWGLDERLVLDRRGKRAKYRILMSDWLYVDNSSLSIE